MLGVNLDGRPFDPEVAANMCAQLDCFGHDGKELLVKGHYALAYQRHWTVPEEVGERQPLYDRDLDVWLLWHGRLDNRSQLFSRLGLQPDSSLSDAALVLAAYKHFGETIFADLIGPFVLVLFYPRTNHLIALRDCMGGRYLVYRLQQDILLLSTFEMALVAHPSVNYEIAADKALKLLSNQMDAEPQSMIKGLTPLRPGQRLRVKNTRLSKDQFYLPDPELRTRLAGNAQYAEQFKYLLTQAVNRRLRANGTVGSMLSGGLDSVPMSITAAQSLQAKGQDLQAYSWVFDQHPQADERRYSNGVCEDFDIQAHWILCDEIRPRFDSELAAHPLLPFGNPYIAWQQALFAKAQSQRTQILLSGMGGDMLYAGTNRLILELFFGAQWRPAIKHASFALRQLGVKQFLQRYVLDYRQPSQYLDLDNPLWVADSAKGALSKSKWWLAEWAKSARRPRQYAHVLSSLEGEDAHYGRHLDARYQIERRYPYRDRDLAEFMLSIPSDQLFFNQHARPIVRRAFRQQMREEMRARSGKAEFASVIDAAIKRDTEVQNWLNQGDQAWRKFVSEQYVKKTEQNSQLRLISWHCAYYQWWKTVCYTCPTNELG